ncbi:similar to stage IV sporulation protein [Virgibacillus subterraneus]|uniref:Similar to stage IV sporulation protein n=2 Tax=Virgibacillus TaxID=84406 RepID=A0A1H1BA99_9BACI|nr:MULTISPECIES: sporulation protein YqfD [Virgibacillus]SDQ48904.1 similar to stage IV sporulation protein [Virgibacillus salinus]SEQ17772.1 similar to stage IV sporulation protein [Virgibacillus subterraneus]
MKHIQGSFITGYMTILIKGRNPELFFQFCIDQGITVWNIKKVSENACKGNVKLSDIDILKDIKRRTSYKLTFINKRGLPFLFKQYTRKKEVMVGLLLSIMLIFFLSNIIWEVKIIGVPKDIEEKISEQLTEYGIHQGAWTFTLDPPSEVQQQLVNDVPELLWVGVHQKGTSYVLEGVEKTIVKEEEVQGPRNLVATKKGVIQKMYVSKGLPKVQVNDYVEPGQVLVSGKLNFDDSKEDKKYDLVAAEGEIIAKTWYETEVTIPLEANHELLTGNRESKYHLSINEFELPVWGFSSPDFNDIHRERNERDLYFLKWKLPVKIIETILSEKRYNKIERSKNEAIDIGIQQAKNELQLQLGPDARIVSEKVLHETIENGKVKLILYMAVEENIVKEESIDQGD